jgi:hypothetical protein
MEKKPAVLPRMTTRRWMLVVAVFAGSLALGGLQEGPPRPVVVGLVCLIASLPMLVVLIEFISTLRSPD